MKTEIAALCLSIKFKQDLHSPQKLIIFAVGKVSRVLSLFSYLVAKGLARCVKMRCNLRQIILQDASDDRII